MTRINYNTRLRLISNRYIFILFKCSFNNVLILISFFRFVCDLRSVSKTSSRPNISRHRLFQQHLSFIAKITTLNEWIPRSCKYILMLSVGGMDPRRPTGRANGFPEDGHHTYMPYPRKCASEFLYTVRP